MFATASTAEKLERATELGADVAINYADDKDWDATVRRLTGKRGVDVIVETVGAATWERSIRALGKGGRLVTSGATSGPIGPTDIRYLFRREHTIQGSNGWTHNDLLTIMRARLRREAAPGRRPRAAARADRGRRAGHGAPRGHRQGRHPAVGARGSRRAGHASGHVRTVKGPGGDGIVVRRSPYMPWSDTAKRLPRPPPR